MDSELDYLNNFDYTLKIVKCRDVNTPTNKSIDNAGYDIYIPNDFKPVILKTGDIIKIPSGLKLIIPKRHYIKLTDRSSVSLKGLKTLAPIIDCNYTGEFSIVLININNKDIELKPGLKIAQIILQEYKTFNIVMTSEYELNKIKTDRSDKGFGSSGAF
jgi:dUTP pyrophosphatase